MSRVQKEEQPKDDSIEKLELLEQAAINFHQAGVSSALPREKTRWNLCEKSLMLDLKCSAMFGFTDLNVKRFCTFSFKSECLRRKKNGIVNVIT